MKRVSEYTRGYNDACSDAINVIKGQKSSDKQPSLNENQQIVVKWLKKQHKEDVDVFYAIHYLMSGDVMETELNPAYIALSLLNVQEQNQVLQVFASWALEQEEE